MILPEQLLARIRDLEQINEQRGHLPRLVALVGEPQRLHGHDSRKRRGGTASDTVTIAVVDATPPVFTSTIGPFTITATDPGGMPFAVPLPDASDNWFAVFVSSDAPALFPIGTTTVTFTATDGAGNTASSSTTVTVVALTLDALMAKVRALPLPHGLIGSLLAKLEAASRSYARGNVTAGDNQLGAFVNEVEALGPTGRLDRSLADDLIAHAQAVIAAS